MELRLITFTTNLEPIIASAVLTTTSGSQPSVLFSRMIDNPEKVAEIIQRIELQHGSIFEHNRFIWIAEAEGSEVLSVILRNRYFTITRLDSNRWLVSGNLRSIIEYLENEDDEFSKSIIVSLRESAQFVYNIVRRKNI